MSSVYRRWRYFALSIACAAGMTGFAGSAQARGQSKDVVRDAQQKLQSDNMYKGQIDGIDGPQTHAAIRKFQQQNNLKVSGKLDQDTLSKLGVQNQGEANRSMNNANRSANENQTSENNENNQGNTGQTDAHHRANRSASTVKAAQQQLEQKGLYHGKTDGMMNSQTKAAIRQYQQQNNLKVTGTLDKETMDSLGVSNTGSNTNTGTNTGK